MAQATKKTTKRVYGHHRRRTWDNIFTPYIRLEGLYLEKAGFNIGDKINIDLKNKQIIISKGGQNG